MNLEWLIMICAPILGHVLYGIPPNPDETRDSRVTLHNGDGFSALDEAPHPKRLHSIRAMFEDGEVVPLAASGDRASGVSVDVGSVRNRPCWVVVETPKTFIELEPEKFQGYLEHEGLHEVIRQRTASGRQDAAGREIYSKYVKIALPGAGGETRLPRSPVGLPIEIIPMLDGALTAGTTLPVRVAAGGRPAANLQSRVSHRTAEGGEPSTDTIYRTDRRGEAHITIDRTGLWRVHTILMTPRPDLLKADWESIWASLTFRV